MTTRKARAKEQRTRLDQIRKQISEHGIDERRLGRLIQATEQRGGFETLFDSTQKAHRVRIQTLDRLVNRYRKDHALLHTVLEGGKVCDSLNRCAANGGFLATHATTITRLELARFWAEVAGAAGMLRTSYPTITGSAGEDSLGAVVALLHEKVELRHVDIALLLASEEIEDRLPLSEERLASKADSVRKAYSEFNRLPRAAEGRHGSRKMMRKRKRRGKSM